jgi:hypothetical protein
MTYDERGLEGVLARGQVRVVGGMPERRQPPISERAFMQAVRREALANNYMFYHTFDSRRSAPGFFDCVLAKPGYPLVLAELKTETGIITIEQKRWYDTVVQATGVECYLWRPDDMEDICRVLRG